METALVIVALILGPGLGPRGAGVHPFPQPQQQAPDGDWQGVLRVGGTELRIVFHIVRAEDGRLSATLDSPDQGAFGIAASAVTASGDSLTITVAALAGEFSGRLALDGERIEGVWKQGGFTLPLVLEATDEPPTPPARPQEPTEPFPYAAEDVSFENAEADLRLAGTLTVPDGSGPHPAVVLVSGSGPQDRDEAVFGHRPFLVLADDLTRRGIAVLRYDDRGVGGSNGDFGAATTPDFVTDALAAVDYLRGRPEVDPSRIGLIGHSEGALVAPLAANRSSDVAFIVLLAAPALKGRELLTLQAEAIGRAGGVSQQVLDQQLEVQATLLAVVDEVENDDAAREELRSILAQVPGVPQEAVAAQVGQLLSPWMRWFVGYDPVPALRRVTVPVLAVSGEKDLQVPVDANLPLIESALEAGGNADFTVRELPGLNHLFQTATTGSPAEYSQIEETMSPAALDVIGEWIVERFLEP